MPRRHATATPHHVTPVAHRRRGVVRRWSSRRHKFPRTDSCDKRPGIATPRGRLPARHLSKATLDLIRGGGMIATCYDSFIISRRVIPRNPAPQFIRRDVPLYSMSRRIVRDVASRTSPAKRLRVGADAAPSKYITAGATIFFEVGIDDDFRHSLAPSNHLLRWTL